jgi:hypothetical protein
VPTIAKLENALLARMSVSGLSVMPNEEIEEEKYQKHEEV